MYDIFLDRAAALSTEQRAEFDSAKGARVRVLRSLVFEGRGDYVLRQCAMSLPVGEKVVHPNGLLSITVAEAPIEFLGEFEDPTVARRALVAEANNALQTVATFLDLEMYGSQWADENTQQDARDAVKELTRLLGHLRA